MNHNKMCLSMLYTLVHRELYLSYGILSPYMAGTFKLKISSTIYSQGNL